MALLIDELRKSGTPINTFFKEYFPNLPKLRQSDFLQMKHAPLLVRPTVPRPPPVGACWDRVLLSGKNLAEPGGDGPRFGEEGLVGRRTSPGDGPRPPGRLHLSWLTRTRLTGAGMNRSTDDPNPHVLDVVDALHELAKASLPVRPAFGQHHPRAGVRGKRIRSSGLTPT